MISWNGDRLLRKKIHERYGKEKIDVYIKVEGENVKLRL